MATAASIIFDLLMRTGSFETDAARAEKALKKVKKGADDLNKTKATDLSKLLGARSIDGLLQFGKLGGIAFIAAKAVSEFTHLSDAGTKLTGVLRNVTDKNIDFGQSFADIKRISSIAQTDLQGIGVVYARVANSLKDFGASQSDVAKVTESLSLALKVNGATSEETASTLIQLSQAFGKGKLDGDEFRTAMEAAPNIMHQLAKSLGVPFGALKDLAAQGKLTSDVLLKAFTDDKYLSSLREQAKSMITIGGALTELKNSLIEAVIEINKGTGAGQIFAETLRSIAGGIKLITDLLAGNPIDFMKGIPTGSVFQDPTTGKVIVGTLKEINAEIEKSKKTATQNYFSTLYPKDFEAKTDIVVNSLDRAFSAFQRSTKGLQADSPKYKQALSDLKDVELKQFGKVNFLPQGSLMSDFTKQFEADNKRLAAFMNNPDFTSASRKKAKDLKELRDAFAEATKGLEKESPAYLDALKAFKEKEQEILDKGVKKPKKGKKTEDQKDLEDALKFVQSLQEQADKLGLTDTQTLHYEQSLHKLSPSQKDVTNNLIDQIDAYTRMNALIEQAHDITLGLLTPAQKYANTMSDLNELYKANLLTAETYFKAQAEAQKVFNDSDETVKEITKNTEDYFKLISKTPSAKWREFGDAIETVNKRFEQTGSYKEYIAGIDAAFKITSKEAKKTSDEVSEFFKEAARGIQNALSDFLFDPFKDGLKGMIDGFSNAIRRMVADAIAARLAKSLFGDLLEGGDGAGSLIGGAVDFFKGIFGGSFADGGMPPTGKVSIVGENGPELFVPKTAGTIIPNDIFKSAGQVKKQTIAVNNTFVVQGNVDRRSQQQVATHAYNGVMKAVKRNS